MSCAIGTRHWVRYRLFAVDYASGGPASSIANRWIPYAFTAVADVIRTGLIALKIPLTMGLRCVPDFGDGGASGVHPVMEARVAWRDRTLAPEVVRRDLRAARADQAAVGRRVERWDG
jgi:hypothetical protein